MAVVLESDAKRLLAGVRAVVPAGRAVADADAARAAAEALGGAAAVKALIPTGRKGKAGAVRIAADAEEAAGHAAELLGSVVNGFTVERVYVEEALEIERELYLAIAPSGALESYELLFSTAGGVEVEQHGGDGPASLPVDPIVPLEDYVVRGFLKSAGLEGMTLRAAAGAVADLANFAVRHDAQLLEVNPLAVLADGRLAVVGAMLAVDENALFRHPELADLAIRRVDSLGRPQTELERTASRLNDEIPEGDMRLVEFADGDVGFLTLGGGFGLVALDTLHAMGEMPATAFDMTSGNIEEKFFRISSSVLAVPRLRGLFVGSNISAMTPVPIRVRGLVRALRESDRDLATFPVVVRLPGPSDDEAAGLLAEFPEVSFYTEDVSVETAVEHFVARMRAVAA